jgi:hypothetical protein
MTFVVAKPSKAEVRREISAIKKTTREVAKSPKAARAFLLKNGFITRNNKLSAKYR